MSTILRRSHQKSREAELTYPAALVGSTQQLVSEFDAGRPVTAPAGYHLVNKTAEIDDFPRSTKHLMNWGMQRGAGLQVYAPAGSPHVGDIVVCGFGVGSLRMPVPCRVVWVREDEDWVGFGYGTLPGHPESGEEAFWIRRTTTGIRLGVLAFSRPDRWFTTLGGPIGRLVQRSIIHRYLNSFTSIAPND